MAAPKKDKATPEQFPDLDKENFPCRPNPVTEHKRLMQRVEESSKGLQHLRVVDTMNMLFSHEDSKAMTQLIGSMVRMQWSTLTEAQKLEASLNEANPGE